MVRRPTVDRNPQPVVYNSDFAGVTGDFGKTRTRGRSARTWRGAGGRWLVWVMRVVIWVVLIVVAYNGVVAIVTRETAKTPGPAPASAPASIFPVDLAGAYALEFGQVYLNASPATASQRASQLAVFVQPGTDPQFGWNGSGSLQLQSEQVAGVQVADANHADVTLLARVNGQLMELSVPLYSAGGAMTVSGEPAWLPPPPHAALAASPPPTNADAATQAQLMGQLPAFFQAYGSGNQATLSRFLAPGTLVNGLGGTVSFGSLSGLFVPNGGATRDIVTTVVWHIPAAAGSTQQAALEVRYELTIVKLSGSWYVSSIAASLQPGGQP